MEAKALKRTEDVVMTVAEVAEYLKVSPAYIRSLMEDGQIPSFGLPNMRRGTRFRESEILRWLDDIAASQRLSPEEPDPETGL